jgi:hypothetical protein
MLQRFLAYILAALVLFQTLGQEVLVVQFALNQKRITEQYCVNKARPQLHCDGKCYLARRLHKAGAGERKAPAAALAKMKYEVLPMAASFALRPPQWWPLPARRYPRQAPAHCAAVPGAEVFRPPLPQV